jgi:hypothetical protein
MRNNTSFLIGILAACVGLACSSSETQSGTTPAPTQSSKAGTDPAPTASKCGQPGDKGNALGVGKYCNSVADCKGTPEAPLCSIAGDKDTHFCTKLCDAKGDIAKECGSADMTCACDNVGNCGCTPKKCTD